MKVIISCIFVLFLVSFITYGQKVDFEKVNISYTVLPREKLAPDIGSYRAFIEFSEAGVLFPYHATALK